MSTTTNTPGLPASVTDKIADVFENGLKPSKKRSYILYYRFGKIPQLTKVFEFTGDLKSAIIRGREHCIKMGYAFIIVLPFVVDLADQESRKADNPGDFEDDAFARPQY